MLLGFLEQFFKQHTLDQSLKVVMRKCKNVHTWYSTTVRKCNGFRTLWVCVYRKYSGHVVEVDLARCICGNMAHIVYQNFVYKYIYI